MISFKLMRTSAVAGVLSLALLLAGCKGVLTKGEKEARSQAQTVSASYPPHGQKPALLVLTTNSSLGDFLAVLIALNRFAWV